MKWCLDRDEIQCWFKKINPAHYLHARESCTFEPAVYLSGYQLDISLVLLDGGHSVDRLSVVDLEYEKTMSLG